jgi:hypothetical protein
MTNLKIILIVLFSAYVLCNLSQCNTISKTTLDEETLTACVVPDGNYGCFAKKTGFTEVQESETLRIPADAIIITLPKHLLPPKMCNLLDSQVSRCRSGLCDCQNIENYLRSNGYAQYADHLFNTMIQQ